MTRTTRDYLDSIRDERQIWLDGKLVRDVTLHPTFRNTARSIAEVRSWFKSWRAHVGKRFFRAR
jgi:aromatic ring hydroxylase